MHILLVEDDKKLADFIMHGLGEAGHTVLHFESGAQGCEAALTGKFDVAIFDIMLPEMDGLAAIDCLRQAGCQLPVLVLSARSGVADRVKGLRAGGDDYLTKPFEFVELLARLEVLTRRSRDSALPVKIHVCGLAINTVARTVEFDNRTIDLQPREFDLLRYFIMKKGMVISKKMIIEEVWNFHFSPRTNIVEAVVCRLRDKIEKIANRNFIHTVRGVGYVFRE